MKQKQILVVSIILIPFLILTGCDFVFPVNEDPEHIPVISDEVINKYHDDYSDKWRYLRLDSRLQNGYREVYSALCENFEIDEPISIIDDNKIENEYVGIKIRLSQPLRSEDQAKQLYKAIVWDNPNFFYLGNAYSYEGYVIGQDKYYDVFCLTYLMNADLRKKASSELNSAVRNIVDPTFSKVKIKQQFWVQLELHDAMLEICTYDKSVSENKSTNINDNAYNAYGALVEGKAVCEGYSKAMQLLLHDVGIDCTLVSGIDLVSGVSHMWNYVTIDRYNYHLDPTWNDENDMIHHTYFNVTTQDIEKDHKIDTDNLGINVCTATRSQYYNMTNNYIDSKDGNDIAKIVARNMQQDDEIIDLQFSETCFSDARKFIASSKFRPKVNRIISSNNLKMMDFSCYTKELYNVITLYKQ